MRRDERMRLPLRARTPGAYSVCESTHTRAHTHVKTRLRIHPETHCWIRIYLYYHTDLQTHFKDLPYEFKFEVGANKLKVKFFGQLLALSLAASSAVSRDRRHMRASPNCAANHLCSNRQHVNTPPWHPTSVAILVAFERLPPLRNQMRTTGALPSPDFSLSRSPPPVAAPRVPSCR